MKGKVIISLLICLFFVPNAWGWGYGDTIRVMDWNVYIGTDVFGVLTGDPTLPEAIQQINDSDIIARSETICKHIEWLHPDVVFLQEMWRISIPGEPVYDFLLEITNCLDDYVVAQVSGVSAVHDLTYLEIPIEPGLSITVQDRDVVLVQGDVVVNEIDNVPYVDLLPALVPFPPYSLEVLRGYTWIDANIHGKSYRLVNTHLEGFFPFRELQAMQLADEMGNVPDDVRVILGGDFNDEPSSATYSTLILSGFTDRWNDRIIGKWDNGFTCCQDPDLMNIFSNLDKQIDFIFTLNGNFRTISGRVIGDRWYNKTDTDPPLWPSDHGGLIFTLYSY